MSISLLRILRQLLALLLGSTGLFLSLWIVLPAPISKLYSYAVNSPEISPRILLLNVIAVLLASWGVRSHKWQRLVLGISLVALVLSSLPLVQLPMITQQVSTQMQNALGADYETKIPRTVQTQLRKQPFVLKESFRGIPIKKVRQTKGIQFAAPDGIPLYLDVYSPPQLGKYPTLVIIHGGGWQGGRRSEVSQFSRYIAAQGYTVFTIDYRLAPRYRFPTQLKDVQTALTFIQEHSDEYEVDPERIALMGRSAGGHLATLAAYQPDGIPIRGVISYYAPLDLVAAYTNVPYPALIDIREVLENFLGGSPQELPQLYHDASPNSYVRKAVPPTLLVHGSRDQIVKAEFGRDLYNQLRAVGSTAVMLEIPWAEHSFDGIFNGVSNQLALYYTERFLAWTLSDNKVTP